MKPSLALGAPALVALALAPTAASGSAERSHTVSVFAPRGINTTCERVFSLMRMVAGPRLFHCAMQALLTGPTPAKTAGHLPERADLRRRRIHRLPQLRLAHPNAPTSCGGALLLAQLDRTARQFFSVKRSIYSFDRSRRAFYGWLQREPPEG